jgi:putative endonuclease
MTGFVYIMTNKPNRTLYIGVTNDIERRVWEHKNKSNISFTNRYKLNMLVWYEDFYNITEAISKEKQMKEWRRQWKIKVIFSMNPEWQDLALNWYNGWTPAFAGVTI